MEINIYQDYLVYDGTNHSLDSSAMAWNFTYVDYNKGQAGSELLKYASDLLK